jgi:hypothetical protein
MNISEVPFPELTQERELRLKIISLLSITSINKEEQENSIKLIETYLDSLKKFYYHEGREYTTSPLCNS